MLMGAGDSRVYFAINNLHALQSAILADTLRISDECRSKYARSGRPTHIHRRLAVRDEMRLVLLSSP